MQTHEIKAELKRLHGIADGRIREVERDNAELRERLEDIEAKGAAPGISQKHREQEAEVKAFNHFCRTGDLSELKAMSIAGGAAAGGAAVPELIARDIINKALAKSPIASAVRRTLVGTSDYVRLVNLRGQAAAWINETGTRSETASLQFREIRPTHGELYSVVGVTRWLLEDSQFNLNQVIVDNAADQFSKSLEAALIAGDGTNKPTGLLDSAPTTASDGASPSRAQDVLQYVAGTADTADDIISLYFALKPEYRQRAQFAMSSATLSAIRKLRDANGSGFLWQQNLSAGVDAPDGLLLGKRVITTEELGVLGASPANNAVLCGDFEQGYELVNIGGMTIIRDDVTEKGRVLFYIAQRFGGRITDNDSIKVLQG